MDPYRTCRTITSLKWSDVDGAAGAWCLPHRGFCIGATGACRTKHQLHHQHQTTSRRLRCDRCGKGPIAPAPAPSENAQSHQAPRVGAAHLESLAATRVFGRTAAASSIPLSRDSRFSFCKVCVGKRRVFLEILHLMLMLRGPSPPVKCFPTRDVDFGRRGFWATWNLGGLRKRVCVGKRRIFIKILHLKVYAPCCRRNSRLVRSNVIVFSKKLNP